MVRYWVVRMTMKSSESNVLDCEIGKNNKFVGIGWEKIGDLTGYTTKESLKILRGKLKDSYNPETSGTLNNWVSHINSFINRIEVNSIVFLPIYEQALYDPNIVSKKYSVGKVKSYPYYRKEPKDRAYVKNRRDVNWLSEITKEGLSVQLNRSLESPHTVYNIDKHEREIQALLKEKS